MKWIFSICLNRCFEYLYKHKCVCVYFGEETVCLLVKLVMKFKFKLDPDTIGPFSSWLADINFLQDQKHSFQSRRSNCNVEQLRIWPLLNEIVILCKNAFTIESQSDSSHSNNNNNNIKYDECSKLSFF